MSAIAIISDIHGNLHALQAVLARIRALRIRDVVCLGDIVGYGPFPGRCLDLVTRKCRHIVVGNHDTAAFDPDAARNFNGNALLALLWTRQVLQLRHLDMLRLLPRVVYLGDQVMCLHDCPVEAATDYVHDAHMAALAFRGVDTRICLIGHTHVPLVFEAPTARVEDHFNQRDIAVHGLGDGQIVRLTEGRRYICNPGSVGQPRDNDPRASFAVLDTDQWSFTIHRVMYDIDAARLATQRAGLPAILAERLAVGA